MVSRRHCLAESVIDVLVPLLPCECLPPGPPGAIIDVGAHASLVQALASAQCFGSLMEYPSCEAPTRREGEGHQ
jgi:hypothetical protein